ncbi:MAG: hypothetical protein PHR96_02400, partial [Clostridia bacterium]|nr:hypothetical protein [Clostridia bacterium]
MFMLNKRTQKLIAKGTALLMSLTALFVTAWAILSTEKVGLTVNVSFDSAVTAKVYLATDSSTAVDFKQPNSTVTAENFAKANSALVLDTKDGGTLTKSSFEALGTGNGLKCNANGEMEFYVYVENYSTTESVFCETNIEFTGANGMEPFSVESNPTSTAFPMSGGDATKSLLTFKIKSTNVTGLNANTIAIEIDLKTTCFVLGVSRLLSSTSSAWTKTNDNFGLVGRAYTSGDFSQQDAFAMAVNGGTLDFYKDIDIVNMRVSDGEIVARLSDSTSGFVWTGTRSGEQVDVMTYYPGHYIKRWQDATNEYIQLSMWDFDGAQYIEPYYRGTFKSIIDTTTYGNTETTKILRSYAGSVPTGSLTIDKFRDYAGNKTDNEMSIGDWRDFDFQCLYLIKYADYNSQSKVGLGITNSSYSSVQA